ncbi:class II aldolase/adducin family protein [Kribbella qitaiheensis]|uniref:Class II aldolase/adducin family protein n=2 Tax=Kribbella qitaiheensis TaxID=1544730 RepID=A0A7G6XAG4_9ACTN|nr:class II aldolase/adducin family protein [Kribbella qitaiheensis]
MRVVTASRALADAGQQDMVWGHVAIRDPAGRGVWLKRSGLGFDELEPDDIQLIDWSGRLLAGQGAVHLECHIHLEIQRARTDVGASVHTHSPAVNAFSALDVPLRAISHEGVLFADPPVPRAPLSGDLIWNPERGRIVSEAIGTQPACILPRHGLVAAGVDEAHAVMYAVLLEAACDLHLRAQASGKIVSFSDEDELRDKRARVWPESQLRAGYDYLVRRSSPPS